MRTFIQHIRFSALLLPAVAALALSCGKLQSPGGNGGGSAQDGDATVEIAISSAPLTKAEDGSTKYAKDGDKMKNLRVWMVDESNKVSAYASSANTGKVTFGTDGATATVTFSNVTRGGYTLYLLANDNTSLTSYGAGSTIDDSFTKAALSLPDSSLTYPEYDENAGMPLSLKKSISVGPGKNSISAELVRVCGQINVTINNRTTDRLIYITGLSLSQRSPSSGYVFQQDDHSSPSATQGNLASTSTLTRIEAGQGSKMLSCYLFENCADTAVLKLNLSCNLYAKGVTPTITTTTKSSYKAGATVAEKTNTDIDADKYYFLASASSPMQFLMIDENGNLAINDVGSDDELFVKDDITSYLWQFSAIENNQTSLKNVGKDKYVNISFTRNSSSYSLGSSQNLLTNTILTGRQFYNTYQGKNNTYYSYLYNNSGSIGATKQANTASTATNTGWYLREATAYEYEVETLTPDPEKSRTINVNKLTYTDSYGEIQPLTKVCRNDKVEIIVNLFYNPLTSSFDFQVEPWRTKDNQTTFD